MKKLPVKKWIITCFLLITGMTGAANAQQTYQERVQQYVDNFKEMAIAEQRRTGVPAAIKLGQGILETEAGNSRLCAGANNHFGIKCKTGWNGETFSHTDDAPDECFRKYSCAQDSYTDHSDFLRRSPRYASLFQLKQTDYKGWAQGLKRCGYATNPRYAPQLIKIIEDFRLHEYTLAAMQAAQAPLLASASAEIIPDMDKMPDYIPPAQYPSAQPDTPVTETKVLAGADIPSSEGVHTINGLRAFYAHKGDMLLGHAMKYKIRYAKLLELNDLPDAPLEANMFIYLERKNNKGAHQRYILQPGETLLQVAQAQGIQLKQLRIFNQLGPDEEPVAGSVLYLQQNNPKKPAIAKLVAQYRTAPAQKKDAAPSDYIEKQVNTPKAGNQGTLPSSSDKLQMQTSAAGNNVNTGTVRGAEGKGISEVSRVIPEDSETPLAPDPATGTSGITQKAAAGGATQAIAPANANTFNIAKEAAVEETTSAAAPTNAGSYNTIEGTTADETTSATPANANTFNIARETAVEETAPDSGDELSRLKARMDKVVYSKTPSIQNAGSANTGPAPVAAIQRNTDAGTAATTSNPAPATTAVTPASATPGAPEGDKFYTVKKGDTAFGIAKKHGITMEQFRSWNKLDFQKIAVGQKLKVKP